MASLKWTLERASREFNVAPVTLRKFLRQGSAEPDEAGCFSTGQICSCLYGDLKAERLRKERELTKRYRLENEITEANLLNRQALETGFAALADAIVSRIRTSNLDRASQDDLLRELSSIPLICENVAKTQSKLRRRAKNGQEEERVKASKKKHGRVSSSNTKIPANDGV
jgi:hypothetical protein